MQARRIVVVIMVAGLAAIAAGCGGGGKKSSAGTTPSASTEISKATTTSGGAEPSNGTPSFASAKNCQDLAGLASKVASSMTTSGNPATALQNEADVLQGLANAAPSDIRGDFQTFATAFTGFLHALEKAGYKPGSTTPPTAAQAAKFAKAAQAFDTPKLTKAEQHLEAWGKQNCKGVHIGG
jgi:hypothetical protein